jgi:hypothetical protein
MRSVKVERQARPDRRVLPPVEKVEHHGSPHHSTTRARRSTCALRSAPHAFAAGRFMTICGRSFRRSIPTAIPPSTNWGTPVMVRQRRDSPALRISSIATPAEGGDIRDVDAALFQKLLYPRFAAHVDRDHLHGEPAHRERGMRGDGERLLQRFGRPPPGLLVDHAQDDDFSVPRPERPVVLNHLCKERKVRLGGDRDGLRRAHSGHQSAHGGAEEPETGHSCQTARIQSIPRLSRTAPPE